MTKRKVKAAKTSTKTTKTAKTKFMPVLSIKPVKTPVASMSLDQLITEAAEDMRPSSAGRLMGALGRLTGEKEVVKRKPVIKGARVRLTGAEGVVVGERGALVQVQTSSGSKVWVSRFFVEAI